MNKKVALSAKLGSKAQFESALGSIDWGFEGRIDRSHLESIHPYPAKFIPQIPAALLDTLPTAARTAVLDPFAGSGTTLVECQKRGIASVGIDLNPIACLISRVKTAKLPDGIDAELERIVGIAATKTAKIPAIPKLDHWFQADVQEAVSRLAAAINSAPKYHQDVFKLALSSILVRISNQESDTRYAAIDKSVNGSAISTYFCTAARRIILALKSRSYDISPTKIIQNDTLKVSAKNIGRPIGAVITSPPYPNAYEYWLYHKYRMYWLGFDPIAVREKEIGARAHFFKKTPHTAGHFADQMKATFKLIDSVLIPSGFVSFVVGRSRIHGEIIDNAKIVEDAAKPLGFKVLFKTERAISSSRKSFNLSHANIKTETVLVLTR